MAALIAARRADGIAVAVACRALGVSRSWFYKHKNGRLQASLPGTYADTRMHMYGPTFWAAMTRITVDLDPPVHSVLNLWSARNAAAIGPPHVELAEVIAGMVVITARYQEVTDAVCSQIRDQRAAARERGERGRG